MKTHDMIRRAVVRHGIGKAELVAEMRRQRLCAGREEEMIDRVLDGGNCVYGVAIALFSLIGQQNCATRH